MASSSKQPPTLSQTSVPIFDGEAYDHWNIMMKTLFRSNGLWEIVDKGFSEEDPEPKLTDNR